MLAEQQKADATAAKELDAAAMQRFSEALNHPETGFLVRQGRDAVLGYPDAAADLDKIRKEVLSEARTPAVKQLLGPILAERKQRALDALGKHSGQEGIKYQAQTAASHALAGLEDAASDPADESRFQEALEVAQAETGVLAELHGWDEATARRQADQYRDTGYRLRYKAWALTDPLAALESFQSRQGEIGPVLRDQIAGELYQKVKPQLTQPAAAWIESAGSAPADHPELANEARGIRNNNPGNIELGQSRWQGEVPGNDPRFATFDSPEAGIRAMGKNLLTYRNEYGIDTVEGIVSRWANPKENGQINTDRYIAAVAKALGVKPDERIDVSDAAVMDKTIRTMI
jgi:hypothetical protein